MANLCVHILQLAHNNSNRTYKPTHPERIKKEIRDAILMQK